MVSEAHRVNGSSIADVLELADDAAEGEPNGLRRRLGKSCLLQREFAIPKPTHSPPPHAPPRTPLSGILRPAIVPRRRQNVLKARWCRDKHRNWLSL